MMATTQGAQSTSSSSGRRSRSSSSSSSSNEEAYISANSAGEDSGAELPQQQQQQQQPHQQQQEEEEQEHHQQEQEPNAANDLEEVYQGFMPNFFSSRRSARHRNTRINTKPRTSMIVHETLEQATQDCEDHTFCGVMFDVQANDDQPVDFVMVESVAVRGWLGRLSVYIPKAHTSFRETSITDPKMWKRVYGPVSHNPSYNTYKELPFDEKITLRAGQTLGIYVHSEDHTDQSIVYDNSGSRVEHENKDNALVIKPRGMAHLFFTPFANRNPWGFGSGWRHNREFVGSISYSVRWLLWQIESHNRFPETFRNAAKTLVMCGYREGSELNMLPQEIVFYIINFCAWNHFKAAPKKKRSSMRIVKKWLGFGSLK